MLEGIKINLGGQEFVAPPLPLKVFRVHPEWFKDLSGFTGIPTPEMVDTMLNIILAALQRNYPELTIEALELLLDIVNTPQIFAAIMGQQKGEAASQ